MVLPTPKGYKRLPTPKTTHYTVTRGITGDYTFKHTVHPEVPITIIKLFK